MTPLVGRLALTIPAPCVCVETPLCNQHLAAVEAIRTALREAAKVAREHENAPHSDGDHYDKFCSEVIASTIEALAE